MWRWGGRPRERPLRHRRPRAQDGAPFSRHYPRRLALLPLERFRDPLPDLLVGLEPWRTVQVQPDRIGHLALRTEEVVRPHHLAGSSPDARRRRPEPRPLRAATNQAGGHRIGQGVGHLVDDVGRLLELDRAVGTGCPERLFAGEGRVQGPGHDRSEVLGEPRQLAVRVGENAVPVIREYAIGVEADAVPLCRQPEGVLEHSGGECRWAEQEHAGEAAPGEEVGGAFDDAARGGHSRCQGTRCAAGRDKGFWMVASGVLPGPSARRTTSSVERTLGRVQCIRGRSGRRATTSASAAASSSSRALAASPPTSTARSTKSRSCPASLWARRR